MNIKNVKEQNMILLANISEVAVRALKSSSEQSIIAKTDGHTHTDASMTQLVVDGIIQRLTDKSRGH